MRADSHNREENKRGESNITKQLDTILKDIKNNGKTIKSISRDSDINLHPLILKLRNAEKTMLKKDDEFDEVFNIFNNIYKKA